MNLGSMKGTVLQSLLLYREARLPGRIFAADIPRGAFPGAPLTEARSTAYEDLIVKALLNDLVVVSS